MSEVQAEVSLVDKPNTKSAIWKCFGFVPGNNGKPISTEKPQCKICRATVSIKMSNTTNLHLHLQQKHPQLCAGLIKTSEKECSSLMSKAASKVSIKNLFVA